jgi:hypothetical protein|tara:strand:- start:36 stop:176 length:141 start_codon:yes stop_codon:yes gene_type:complete
MPTKKPETPNTEPTKAVVSKLGVSDEPTKTEPKVVKTKNGNTMTFN